MPAKNMQINGADIVADAQRYLGVPYLYGGTNPKVGLDCSGLVQLVCHDVGITSCPRTSEEQWAWTNRVAAGEERTGDLVFIVGSEQDPSPGHVMIVVNPGNPEKVIDAPFTGTVVRYDTYSRTGTGVNQLVGYGRIPGTVASPTGSASTQPVPTDKTSVIAQAGAAAAALGAGIGFFVMGIVVLAGLVLLWKVIRP